MLSKFQCFNRQSTWREGRVDTFRSESGMTLRQCRLQQTEQLLGQLRNTLFTELFVKRF